MEDPVELLEFEVVTVGHTPIWIGRVALVFLCGMLVSLAFVDPSYVSVSQQNGTTVYSSSSTLGWYLAGFGIVAGIFGYVAITFGPRFKLYGIGFAGITAFLFFLFVDSVVLPDPHSVTVTPAFFHRKVGSYCWPIEQKIEFDNVYLLHVGHDETAENPGDTYVISCTMKPDGDEINVPFFALMKRAWPEISERAQANGVFVIED